MTEPRNYWQHFRESAAATLSISLSDFQMQQFESLYQLVTETNKTMNLTRITSLEDFCTRHLLDSLTLVPLLSKLGPQFSLVDIGSGAGFPALPLAIVFPDAMITAVESVLKKARFIEQSAESLGLNNVKVLAERSEILAHLPTSREQFDIATARAVSPLNVLAELCLPYVKPGGQMLAMKTASALDSELSAAGLIRYWEGSSLRQ